MTHCVECDRELYHASFCRQCRSMFCSVACLQRHASRSHRQADLYELRERTGGFQDEGFELADIMTETRPFRMGILPCQKRSELVC